MNPIPENYANTAKQVVAEVSKNLEDWDEPLDVDLLYVVWFVKVLQNWKALVSTNQVHGAYFEVTYNGDAEEVYVDTYTKDDNHMFSKHYIDTAIKPNYEN